MLRGQHVLIIEDEPLIALDLEQALSSAGAVVHREYRRECTRGCRVASVTAAIVDLRLHERSVRDVVERLAIRNLPFVFYSGQTETHTASSWPGVPLLLKPLPPKEVVEMLARVVAVKASGISIPSKKGGPV